MAPCPTHKVCIARSRAASWQPSSASPAAKTVLATIDYDITLPLFDYKLLKGDFYLYYELVLDMFGLFFVIGLGMAVWRRFVLRPARIDPEARFACQSCNASRTTSSLEA